MVCWVAISEATGWRTSISDAEGRASREVQGGQHRLPLGAWRSRARQIAGGGGSRADRRCGGSRRPGRRSAAAILGIKAGIDPERTTGSRSGIGHPRGGQGLEPAGRRRRRRCWNRSGGSETRKRRMSRSAPPPRRSPGWTDLAAASAPGHRIGAPRARTEDAFGAGASPPDDFSRRARGHWAAEGRGPGRPVGPDPAALDDGLAGNRRTPTCPPAPSRGVRRRGRGRSVAAGDPRRGASRRRPTADRARSAWVAFRLFFPYRPPPPAFPSRATPRRLGDPSGHHGNRLASPGCPADSTPRGPDLPRSGQKDRGVSHRLGARTGGVRPRLPGQAVNSPSASWP